MIKYNPKNWFKLIFALHKSDTMRMLWKEILYIGAFSALLSFLIIEYATNTQPLHDLVSVYSLVGFVISLLLVFRTNTAYDRWWEGRKKWGCLVNDTRNLAIKISAIVPKGESSDFFCKSIPNFVFASKEHLRKGVDLTELELTAEEFKVLEKKVHVPNAISLQMYQKLQELKSDGKVSEVEYLAIDNNLNALLDSLGACERIRNTPIPFSYSLFLKKFIFIFVTTIPLAFIPSFGYYSIIIAMFLFYVLVSMEVLAEEIEEPFGDDDNDLPTDQLCVKIRENVREIFEVR
ncbi:MAG: putative membrane protein [Crocinitomicaceae bacterium]|jgi:putative membrane protein